MSPAAVMPGIVRTDFLENASAADRLDAIHTFMQLTPDQVVKSSVRAAQKGKAISVPGWGYDLAAAIIGVTPRRFVRWFSGVTARRMDQTADAVVADPEQQ